MGLLKKLTKPLSKILDKIVPNEVKPFLPYLAAMAPFMMGPTGIMGSSMMRRALMSGALNIGSQLSQEGSEGEFSGISALLAAGTGAMTAPGAASTIRGVDPNFIGPQVAPEGFIGTGREYLARGAEFLGPGTGGAADILGKGGTKAGFDMATLKAAALPISQGTADLAMADAQRALRDYENEMANEDQLDLIDDDGRRRAIRAAMEAAGHLEDTILDALGSLGLKEGGIVGLKHGGRIGYDKGGSIAKLIDQGMDPSTALSMWQDWEDSGSTLSFNDYVGYGTTENYARGGLMNALPKGKEADYRGGGVIPIGSRERADDVPARLSKNEFVMTADAVRAAGGGNINQGAKRMYNLMNNLEARV